MSVFRVLFRKKVTAKYRERAESIEQVAETGVGAHMV